MDHFQSRVSRELIECLQFLRILAGMSSCDVAAYASNSSMALMMATLSKSMSWILCGPPWLNELKAIQNCL